MYVKNARRKCKSLYSLTKFLHPPLRFFYDKESGIRSMPPPPPTKVGLGVIMRQTPQTTRFSMAEKLPPGACESTPTYSSVSRNRVSLRPHCIPVFEVFLATLRLECFWLNTKQLPVNESKRFLNNLYYFETFYNILIKFNLRVSPGRENANQDTIEEGTNFEHPPPPPRGCKQFGIYFEPTPLTPPPPTRPNNSPRPPTLRPPSPSVVFINTNNYPRY